MTPTEFILKLEHVRPGWCIKVIPDLSESTGNTNVEMIKFRGKILKIVRVGRTYVEVAEDGREFVWDHNHVESFLQHFKLFKRINL